jgi:hypothetical protein
MVQYLQSRHLEQKILALMNMDGGIALWARGLVLLRGSLAEEELVRTPGKAVIRQAHHGAALFQLYQLTRQCPAEEVPLHHQPGERRPLISGLLGRDAGGVPVRHGAGEPVPVQRDRREPRHRPEAAG